MVTISHFQYSLMFVRTGNTKVTDTEKHLTYYAKELFTPVKKFISHAPSDRPEVVKRSIKGRRQVIKTFYFCLI